MLDLTKAQPHPSMGRGEAMGAWTTPPHGHIRPAVTVSLFRVPWGTGEKHRVTTETGPPPSQILDWLRRGRTTHSVPELVRGRTSHVGIPGLLKSRTGPSDSRDCREAEHPNTCGILGWLSSSSQGGHSTDISHFSLILHPKQKEKLRVSFRPPSSSWGTLSKGCVSGTLKPCT